MPKSIQNPEGITLRKLIQNTHHHYRNRYEYMRRDVLKSVKVKKVLVYDGKAPGQARTKFVIQSSSYPQYAPYYTRRDRRGRLRGSQRTYKHFYDVTIQLDSLSLDTDKFKIRTGSDQPWDFSDKGQPRKDKRGKVIEGTNAKRGVNGDFFFRCSWLFKQAGILYGRNWANGPPSQTNPNGILFLDKHALHVVKVLVDRGVLQ